MKRTLKVLLAAVLSVAMLFSFASAAEESKVGVHHEENSLGAFTDAPAEDNWKFQGLNCAVNNGVMNGHENKLRPDDSLTRAEMVAMMVRVLDAYGIKADISAFVDVVSGSWYYDYISSGVAAKFINGSGNKMMPNDPITREQTFAMLARTFLFTPKTEDASSAFIDEAELSSWAEYATNALIDAKVVLGDNTNTLRPLENVTRAEMAALLDRIVCYFMKSGVDYNGVTIEGSVIYNDPSIDLNGVTINGDLYIVDGIGNASIDLSGVTVTGRVVIRGGEVEIPAGSVVQIVRPSDYNENPQKPDDSDDNKPEDDKPTTSGGGSLPSGGTIPLVVYEGAENNGTYISYGDADSKIWADVTGNTITFDLTSLTDETTGLKNIYISTNKAATCASSYFSEVSFDANSEYAVRDLLTAMVNSTSNAFAPLLGIDLEGGESYTIGNLESVVETAYANYSQGGWQQQLFLDDYGIECSDWDTASFKGTIGGKEFTVVMIVPNFGD